jgi:positive regulator of sigma E activity
VTETGRVTKIEGDIITLRRGPSGICCSCAKTGCAVAQEVKARNPRRIPLQAGDEAEISLRATAGLCAALKMFGIPVLAFAVFYVIAGILSGWKESLCVPAGLAGLILAALVLFFAGRRSAALPEVLRAASGNSEPGPKPAPHCGE